jgi:hypothetical protein
MRGHIQHTSAIIPPDCEYDSDQLEYYGTPEYIESRFVSFYGYVIPDDYALNLQICLKDLHMAIIDAKEKNAHLNYSTRERRLRCEVVMIDICLRTPYCVQLNSILVRPCAQGLGILKLVFWQMIKSCEILGMSFMIDNPLPKTKLFLKRFGSIVFNDKKRKKSFIARSNMHWITLDLVNIRYKILLSGDNPPNHDLILNLAEFPSADVFNDGIDPTLPWEERKLAIEARERLLAAVNGQGPGPNVNRTSLFSKEERDRSDWKKILRSRR